MAANGMQVQIDAGNDYVRVELPFHIGVENFSFLGAVRVRGIDEASGDEENTTLYFDFASERDCRVMRILAGEFCWRRIRRAARAHTAQAITVPMPDIVRIVEKIHRDADDAQCCEEPDLDFYSDDEFEVALQEHGMRS